MWDKTAHFLKAVRGFFKGDNSTFNAKKKNLAEKAIVMMEEQKQSP